MGLADNISINTHSSIRIEGSRVLYFDPFEVQKVSADADIIFITHEHSDHFDPESIAAVRKKRTVIVAPKSMEQVVKENEVTSDMECYFYLPGTLHGIERIDIETIPAYNLHKPFHEKARGWMGYVVTMDGIKYYVAGDTDVTEESKMVKCDVALIPIGGKYTMDKKDAAEFVTRINPRVAIPTHYGSVVGNIADGKDFKDYLEIMEVETEVVLKIIKKACILRNMCYTNAVTKIHNFAE